MGGTDAILDRTIEPADRNP